MRKYSVGDKVVVSEGAGLDSGKTATVIRTYDWHRANDGTYKMPRKNQVPLQYDDGTLGFMYKSYLNITGGKA